MALTSTLQRFPYMASKLVEKNGDFYLEESVISMNVAKTTKLRQWGQAII